MSFEPSRSRAQEDRALFQKEMTSQQQQFERALEELQERVSEFHRHTDLSRITKVVGMVRDIEKALKDYEERAAVFNKRESLFGSNATEYDQLQKIQKEFEPYKDLWLVASDWQRWQNEWLDGPLLDLDPDEVEKGFTNATRSMAKALKIFKDLAVGAIAKQLKAEMESFRPFMPVVTALRNPGMRERHWDALTADLKFELRPGPQFTLRHATDSLRLHEPKTLDKVQKVCERALKEYAIEKALNDMMAGWEGQEFEVLPYRATGTSVIKLSEEVNTLLDDHIVLTQQFSFSPYKGPFEERIADWERKLRLVQEVCGTLPGVALSNQGLGRKGLARKGLARKGLAGRGLPGRGLPEGACRKGLAGRSLPEGACRKELAGRSLPEGAGMALPFDAPWTLPLVRPDASPC